VFLRFNKICGSAGFGRSKTEKPTIFVGGCGLYGFSDSDSGKRVYETIERRQRASMQQHAVQHIPIEFAKTFTASRLVGWHRRVKLLGIANAPRF
jgi:hypothetical protein